MTIELAEKDVRGDIPQIINSMSKIRGEMIKERELSNEQKDEYLHMTYRLASGINAVSDDQMVERMQLVSDGLSRDLRLMKYDPMQDAYWKKKEGDFSNALDDLLITLVRDDFHNADAKHHVLQAVKYLSVEGTSFDEKEGVYDSILPFQGPVPLDKRDGFFKGLASKLFGARYRAKNLNDLTLKIDVTKQGYTPELLEMARERGYTTLRLEIGDNEYDEIKSDLRRHNFVHSRKRRLGEKMTAAMSGLVKWTKPLAYVALGALPQSLQERIDCSLPSFDEENAFYKSTITELVTGIVGSIGLSIYNQNGWPLLFMGLPMVADALLRLICADDPEEGRCGSMILKPFFYPLERHMNKKPDKIMTVDLPVRQIRASEQIPNPIDFYDSIARLKVTKKAESSLVWDNDNHHSFGKEFIDNVEKKKGPGTENIIINTGIDKASQSVSYNHSLVVDNLRKNSSLFCFHGAERYIVTSIGPDGGEDGFVKNTSQVLGGDGDSGEKLMQLANESSARYVHLQGYMNWEKVVDLEA
jgi:hypothetical protein